MTGRRPKLVLYSLWLLELLQFRGGLAYNDYHLHSLISLQNEVISLNLGPIVKIIELLLGYRSPVLLMSMLLYWQPAYTGNLTTLDNVLLRDID